MELIQPTVQYKKSFIEAVREFQSSGEADDRGKRYKTLLIPELESNFEEYVENEKSYSFGQHLPAGYVPETTFWLVDCGEFIGRVSVRHELTEHLRTLGGHIGYDIRPSKRKRGYGTQILKLALPEAKELGITRALLTCDDTNVGSQKIIEANGGVPDTAYHDPKTNVTKLRYWITVA